MILDEFIDLNSLSFEIPLIVFLDYRDVGILFVYDNINHKNNFIIFS